jgi:chromosome partitioning protein
VRDADDTPPMNTDASAVTGAVVWGGALAAGLLAELAHHAPAAIRRQTRDVHLMRNTQFDDVDLLKEIIDDVFAQLVASSTRERVAVARGEDGPVVGDGTEAGVDPHEIIVETPHFDLMPGHEDLSNFDSELQSSGRRGVDEYFVVREMLEAVGSDYDVIVLDCQATLSDLVDNAIVGARNIVVPIELSPKGDASQQGLEDTIDAMKSGFSKMGVDISIRATIPSRVGNAKIFEQYRERIENERDVPLSPFSIPEHSLLRYTWDKKMDLFEFIESDETRDLRSYEEHVPLAFKVIGRWLTGDLSYADAVAKWDDVKDQEMGDATPEALLDESAGEEAA